LIVAKIEYWPHGIEAKAEQIAVVTIANDRSGTWEHGNYDVVVTEDMGEPDAFDEITGRVEAFPRTNRRALDLLFLALRETVGGRNREKETL
jgi:hypothetical protein